MATNTSLTSLAILASLTLTTPSWAQVDMGEEGGDEAVALDEAPEEDLVDLDTDADAEDLQQDTAEGQALDDELDELGVESEEEEDAKYLIGLRYRAMVVPKFLINMFGVEGARTIGVHGIGPEFGFAMEHMDIVLSGWWASYGMGDTPFKGPNDGDEAWEIINSDLSQFYITADLLWKQPVSKKVDFVIGAGLGIGIVLGKLYRNEAFWNESNGYTPGNPGDPYTDLEPCAGPGVRVPGAGDPYGECPADGSYAYPDANGNYTNAADAWPAYPWVTFQTGLRYAPVKEFVGRLDLGIGSSGFWLGIGADYGI